jgi:dynein heavy chain
MSILKNFLNPEMLKDEYKFNENGVYKIPEGYKQCESIVKYVHGLPDIDSPEIFGMNDNADVAFQLSESNMMVDTILNIQPRTGGSGKTSPDEIVYSIATKIKEKLPELITKEGASKDLFKVNKRGLVASLTTYLMQEMERFNLLIDKIDKSLEELEMAIKGLAVMSEEMDMMYRSILINKVPENWSLIAYPSLKPLGSWIDNLVERVDFIKSWLMDAKLKTFWMP